MQEEKNNLPKNEGQGIPLKLSWKDLTYKVKTKKSKKSKLQDVSTPEFKEILKPQTGYVKSGETMFIMGSSGAGKTTLLNALCGRLMESKNVRMSGEVLVNDGHKVTQEDFGKYGAYVMQDDVLFPTLTCEEVITFSAKLKCGLKGNDLRKKVDDTLARLGLLKCRHTRIGNQLMKGLSGGERKRTAIAVELITDPQLLFLDEPTSGLDSFTANKIVQLLVDEARLGKTIIATIHQPSSQTFQLFDRLTLLMDGYTIYQGPAADAACYFDNLGFKAPKYANPADYFLKEFYVPFKRTEQDVEKLERLAEGYERLLLPKITSGDQELGGYQKLDNEVLDSMNRSTPICMELCELVKRSSKNMIRNPNSSFIRILQTIVLAALVNLTFWDLGYSAKDAENKAGFCFFCSINQTVMAMLSIILMFMDERPVFLREYANRTYGVWTYFISKTITEAPFQLIFPVLFSSAIYFGAGMTPEFDRFVIFCVIFVANVLCATSIGLFIGCCFTNASQAVDSSQMILNPSLIFGGFFVNLNSVYSWLSWLTYLSPIRYSAEALMRNEFEDNDRYVNGEQYYEIYDYNIGVTGSIVALLGLAVAFRMAAAVALRLRISKVQ